MKKILQIKKIPLRHEKHFVLSYLRNRLGAKSLVWTLHLGNLEGKWDYVIYVDFSCSLLIDLGQKIGFFFSKNIILKIVCRDKIKIICIVHIIEITNDVRDLSYYVVKLAFLPVHGNNVFRMYITDFCFFPFNNCIYISA